MKIQLIAVGTKMPKWVEEGFQEYRRRFPHDMPLELIGSLQANVAKMPILHVSFKRRWLDVGCGSKGNRIVTLDIPGRKWDTPQLAEQLEKLEIGWT
ncbi:23S rRNA (pseudouridine(1915)-N(3))-methyltransferase RlmH [Shewanella sp. 10N.286.48.B5]|uniref:23S rRNA (pseudouridine(1915)-N(3))-methyltransferase RlmH n=1 Tax=Shewanella sp. 10N.286.48.B5 TaxID=1880834 RepID=UPI0039A4F476